ncbi:protein trichome birefringence-like 42 [Glycine soja]|uniref:protein trichome birefringence-like 42 n=1 Tax=Glycine soja TaxID=3848 RepID=UPI00103EDA42|nr:protein trichome birefringence-like 42 [Glycine soja]
MVSRCALNEIAAELDRIQYCGNDPSSCGCSIRSTHGLPCACELSSYAVSSIPLESVHMFWRRLHFSQVGVDKWMDITDMRYVIASRLCALAFAVLWLVASPLYHVQGNGCDFSLGNWVVDDSYYPLYDASRDCPFIGQGFNCLRNGRTDQEYLKYRWKPSGCDLPRFDGVNFLERYRGKKIMFVGDSISNNMWQSLTCLLHIAVPESSYALSTPTKYLYVFSFPEYDASIMWLKNGFLVDVVHDKENGRIVKLDSIRSGRMWNGVDVLIFNTYHWWTHSGESKTFVQFQVGNEIIKDMNPMEAYKIGLTTWSQWIDANIDPSNTTVLFQGIAASHSGGKGCLKQPQPGQGPQPPYPGVEIVKGILSSMSCPVYLLDITLMTQLRIDGHPSIYTGKGTSYVDCSHWCLAGAPDTWNEMLYAALLGL